MFIVTGIKPFSFKSDVSFEAYIQYKEYIGFVKAMTALRGMKLVLVQNGNAHVASIKASLLQFFLHEGKLSLPYLSASSMF